MDNNRPFSDLMRSFRVTITFSIFVLFYSSSAYAQGLSNVTIINNKEKSLMEIRNGLLGIVIPAESSFKKAGKTLAPIQSFIYSDGIYSDNTPNYLESGTLPIAVKINILINSSEEAEILIEYLFQKKKYEYGGLKFKGAEAGPGYYRCTIDIVKGDKTISIEEETDYDISYSVKISNGLLPDKARYRGWSAADVKYGYEPSGSVYRNEETRGYPLDATVDLDYNHAFSYPRLILWEPAGGELNSGRYWQVFNSKADNHSNLFGFFQGKPSLLIGARSVGPNLEIFPVDKLNNEQTDAELRIKIDRRGPDNSWFSKKRFQWVAFISTKKDLLSPEKQQPIANELNKHSGLGNKVSKYASVSALLIPSFYKGAIYMSENKMAALINAIKSNESLYKRICEIDGGYKGIWDAWRYPDSAKSLLLYLINLGVQLKEQYINDEGTYTNRFRYWKGALNFKYYAFAVSCLFADASIKISVAERKKLEQLVVMMARIVWDEDNVPFFDSAAINFGPANMFFQYQNNGRNFFALLFAHDKEFEKRAKNVLIMVRKDIEQSIYSNGASFGTPHYTQATIDPILFSMLQLKQAGIDDLFKENKKIIKFAYFYSSLVTPPSCRFQGNRKLISFGDGSEESVATFALLASGLQNADSELSAQLLSLYFYGPPRLSYAGPVALAVDLSNFPEKKFSTVSSYYAGYISHFRTGVNTANETAVWALNGDSLFDHRNDDAGEVAIYALKAPLSLSRSSFYYPSATDARNRSVVIPEKLFPEWNGPEQPIAGRSLTNRTWPESHSLEFLTFNNSSSTKMLMKMPGKEWYRQISLISLYENSPIIIFYDSVTGEGSNIWSMLFMSEGPVNTPLGEVTPVRKIYNNADLKQLPQATPMKTMGAGLNHFTFTGQVWQAHADKGINWDLYIYSTVNIDFAMADWSTTWQNDLERNEFYQTNDRSYSEEQQILRLRSNKPFLNILLPYKKGINSYEGRIMQLSPGRILVIQKNDSIYITAAYFYVRRPDGFIISILSGSPDFNEMGVTISGGSAEVILKKDSLKIKIGGNSGKRTILVPGHLKPMAKYNDASIVNNTRQTSILINNKESYNKEYQFHVEQ